MAVTLITLLMATYVTFVAHGNSIYYGGMGNEVKRIKQMYGMSVTIVVFGIFQMMGLTHIFIAYVYKYSKEERKTLFGFLKELEQRRYEVRTQPHVAVVKEETSNA